MLKNTARGKPFRVLPARGFVVPRLRRRERGLCLLDDYAEGRRVGRGEIGEDLAVEADVGLLEAVHEVAVAEAVGAGAGVDARDPQLAKVALLLAAIAIGVLPGVVHRLLGGLDEAVPAAAVSAG